MDKDLEEALRRLFAYSMDDIGYEYESLTETEKSLVAREEYERLAAWAKAGGGQD